MKYETPDLVKLEFLEMVQLYFTAKTGRPCFVEEFLPVKILAVLHQVEDIMHQTNTDRILIDIETTEQK